MHAERYFSRLLTTLVGFCFLALSQSEVIHITTEEQFADVVDGSSNVLVEFYAPWCGHCKNLAPEWAIAGDTFEPSDDIVITAVDATAVGTLASKYKVQGYPTIKYFPKGTGPGGTPEDYDGGRSADTIVKWVNDKVGTSRKVKQPPSHVTVLETDSFNDVVLGSKAALVEFYAPWCGHCKNLAPKYEQLAEAFAAETNVVIGKVDATEEKELAQRYDITGFPQIKFFPAGSAEPKDYSGAREVEAMVEFLNEHAGTERTATGALLPTAGRVEDLDKLIRAADFIVDAALIKAIEAASDVDAAKQAAYVKTAVKVLAKGGVAYVTKEIKRLEGLMSGSSGKSITPEKKGSFQQRRNVLAAFAPPVDAAEEL